MNVQEMLEVLSSAMNALDASGEYGISDGLMEIMDYIKRSNGMEDDE